MATLGRMYAIVATAFQHKYDKGGRPYIEHLIYVSQKQTDDERKIMGLGHDLREDCPEWTEARLVREGFSHRVISGLNLLTHDPEVPYDDYITAIMTNPDAVAVKLADLEHNSNITRMKGLRPKDIERLEKYHRAYARLRAVIF